MRRIGVDVGGTNTDAVLLEDGAVIHAVKTPTSPDVTTGIVSAVDELSRCLGVTSGVIDAVIIGTTHFVNAVVQRRELARVAAVRIGLPAAASLPPFCDWPLDLAERVRGAVFMLEGGHDYDGRPIVPFDEAGMRRIAREIRESGIRAVAVAAIFSPLDTNGEQRARAILGEECPDATVTASHQLGRIGLLERENAALLNAALIDVANATVAGFTAAIEASGITAPLYLTQNDGTVMPAAMAAGFTGDELCFGRHQLDARRSVFVGPCRRDGHRCRRYLYRCRAAPERVSARSQLRRRDRRRAHLVPHARPAVDRSRRRQPRPGRSAGSGARERRLSADR